jgi:hypothetical protein
MSGTPELLGIRSGIVARVVCTHGTVWCAESVAVSCRVPSRRHDQSIESGLCRVSGLCRAVLLCCVALVCVRVSGLVCVRVGSRSVGWGVESGCVVSPCWVESYYVLCMYTVWFGCVTSRVVSRTDWCRVVSRAGRFVWCRVDRFGTVSIGLVRVGVESYRVFDRFGIRAERYAERLRIATRIAFTE